MIFEENTPEQDGNRRLCELLQKSGFARGKCMSDPSGVFDEFLVWMVKEAHQRSNARPGVWTHREMSDFIEHKVMIVLTRITNGGLHALNVRALLVVTMDHAAVDFVRKFQHHPKRVSDELLIEARSTQATPLRAVMKGEVKELIAEHLDDKNDENFDPRRKSVVMAAMEGVQLRLIGERCGISYDKARRILVAFPGQFRAWCARKSICVPDLGSDNIGGK